MKDQKSGAYIFYGLPLSKELYSKIDLFKLDDRNVTGDIFFKITMLKTGLHAFAKYNMVIEKSVIHASGVVCTDFMPHSLVDDERYNDEIEIFLSDSGIELKQYELDRVDWYLSYYHGGER